VALVEVELEVEVVEAAEVVKIVVEVTRLIGIGKSLKIGSRRCLQQMSISILYVSSCLYIARSRIGRIRCSVYSTLV
jgi:hypothetical protein